MKVAVLGYGTVGSGVVEVLKVNNIKSNSAGWLTINYLQPSENLFQGI